jgi:hypothetical protein
MAVGVEPGTVLRSAARGVLAAMAMTAMRRVTKGFGLLREAPPEMIAREAAPALLERLAGRHRGEAVELAHWAYGAAGGVSFGALPPLIRRSVWAGPLYGLGIWAAFEAGIAPLLGLSGQRRWGLSDRIAIAADHVLYGVVVAQPAASQR